MTASVPIASLVAAPKAPLTAPVGLPIGADFLAVLDAVAPPDAAPDSGAIPLPKAKAGAVAASAPAPKGRQAPDAESVPLLWIALAPPSPPPVAAPAPELSLIAAAFAAREQSEPAGESPAPGARLAAPSPAAAQPRGAPAEDNQASEATQREGVSLARTTPGDPDGAPASPLAAPSSEVAAPGPGQTSAAPGLPMPQGSTPAPQAHVEALEEGRARVVKQSSRTPTDPAQAAVRPTVITRLPGSPARPANTPGRDDAAASGRPASRPQSARHPEHQTDDGVAAVAGPAPDAGGPDDGTPDFAQAPPPDGARGAAQRPVVPAADRAAAPAPAPVRPAESQGNEGAPPRLPLAFGARLVASPPRVERVAAASGGAEAQRKPNQSAEPEEPARSKGTVKTGEIQEIVERPAAGQPSATAIAPRGSEPRVQSEPAPPRPEQTQAEARPERAATPHETVRPASPARDIRLEVAGGGEPRVEVRLVERAGEVHFAVRTPDDRLAGALREQLPALSSRLEQSGFRAADWRAAEAGGAERRLDVEAVPAASTEARHHGQRHAGDQPRDGHSRQPQHTEEPEPHKEKGRGFEWLMASLP